MPGPAVYVVAVVASVGAFIVFKEFVYEPHIAPTLERWAHDFLERRRAQRQREQVAVPVSVNPGPSTRRDRSNSDDGGAEGGSVYELEGLISREVDEWRTNVDRSQNQLRFRNNAGSEAERYSLSSNTLDESIASLPYTPIVPTHVISNDSSPMTATLADLNDVFIPTIDDQDNTPWDLYIGSSSLSRTVAPSDDHRTQSQPTATLPPSRTPSVRSPLSQTLVIPKRASTLTPISAAAQSVSLTGSQPVVLSPAPIMATPSIGFPVEAMLSPRDNPFESLLDAAVLSSTPGSLGRTISQSPEILFRSSPSPPLEALQRTPPQYLGSLSERYPAPVSPPIEIFSPVHSPIEIVSPPSTRSGTPPVDISMPMSPAAETFSDFLSPTMSSVDFLSAAEDWEDSDDDDLSIRSPSPERSPRHDSHSASVLWGEYHHHSGSDDGQEGSGSETSSWASVPRRR